MPRLIGHPHVTSLPIGIGVDRNGNDAKASASLDDSAGDLAAIGDQYFREHGQSGIASSAVRVPIPFTA